jgi:rod shape-determining protein MreC
MAAKKLHLRNFNMWIFIILLILSLLCYSIRGNLKSNLVESISSIVLYPFEKAVTFIKNIATVYSENIELRKKLATFEFEKQRCIGILEENERLRELYRFKQHQNYRLMPCEIIGKSPGLYNRAIIIDGGTKDGLKKNMTVISKDGLAGKLIECYNNSSLVLILFNRNCFVSAIDVRSRVQGIITWSGGDKLSMDNVPLYSDVMKNDTIITSGMGEVYPKNIFIGTVTSVKGNPQKIAMQIEVKPFVDYSVVENLFVIVPSEEWSLMEHAKKDTITPVYVSFDIFEKIENREKMEKTFMKYKTGYKEEKYVPFSN